MIILSYIVCLANVFAQNLDTFAGVNASQNVEEQNSAQPKYAWLTALGEVALINVVVHTFDRFITNEDYAQVSFEDIGNNFRRGFVLDNDDFSMNTFFHPYNGSLYFNAARANGLSFWQSAPYTFAGSLMWEFLGENSAPAINDFISTSIGGIALGEMTHRVSMLALDDSSRGLERACREILAGLISPMDLFNRLLSGKAWRYSPSKNGENVYLKENFQIYLSIFNRFMTDLDHNRDRSNMALGLTAIYGASFTDKERLPYDFFIADIDFNIIGNQPTFAETTIVGALWGKQWEKESNAFFAGIFQHFDYYTSISLTNEGKIPYEFAETASFGGGFYFKRQKNEDNPPVFYGNIHINLVLLGASESDHYSVYERNYNFGSGYSVKLAAIVNLSKYFNVFINAKTYQIFTLNDEEDENYDSIYDEYNVPGNNGNTLFNIFSAGLNYRPIDYWSISVEQRFYLRQSHYKFFKDVLTNSMETRIKLTYSVF
ncbi:MAG: DUF3943 domain-containing protein [Endomicrobium sp.]|nr:DUF3943 domain-containing protein [Endomicrobium sp.]